MKKICLPSKGGGGGGGGGGGMFLDAANPLAFGAATGWWEGELCTLDTS